MHTVDLGTFVASYCLPCTQFVITHLETLFKELISNDDFSLSICSLRFPRR